MVLWLQLRLQYQLVPLRLVLQWLQLRLQYQLNQLDPVYQ
jgi:hypothetical protein